MDHFDPIDPSDILAYELALGGYSTPPVPQEATAIATPTAGSPIGEGGSVSVSTVFHPDLDAGLGPSDIKFIAADNVFFFAHIAHIASQSSNRFNGLLPTAPGAAMFVPELSPVFNVVLHTVYGWSCSAFSPTLEDVAAALTALAAYGVSLSTCLARNSPLYAVVLTHAARQPMETYALAAAHDVEHLASAVSSQLLSYRLSELLDEHALRMGARYLLRLAKLQQERMEKLRDLVLAPPEGHLPAPSCGFVQQRTLTAVWANVTAEMSWKARPDLPASEIQVAFSAVEGKLTCALCKGTLKSRVKQILYQWTLAQRTI